MIAVLQKIKVPESAKRLYETLTNTEKLMLAWLGLMLVVSGIWSVVRLVQVNTELVPEPGGIYREALVGQPRHLNPILAGANDIDLDISRLVYSGLFKLDKDLSLQNDLAQEHSVSEDGKTYTVKVRSDATWHDGEPVTADDVVFTIRSIQTPEYGSPLASAFSGVTVSKIDDQNVEFKLETPYAPFLSSLTVGIVPQHVWENIAPENAALAEQMLKPVGAGPYKFAELATRRKTGEVTELTLERYNGFHAERPLLDKIVFAFFDNHDEAVRALTAEQVDGIGFLPLALKGEVEKSSNLEIHRLNLPQYFGLFFNQQQSAVLSDAGLRNALALATDRQSIVASALSGEGEPLHLPIPPGIFGFNDELEAPSYDPESARRELEEAGWTDEDDDGIRSKDDQPLSLTITTTDWPEYVATAEAIKDQWLQVGVDVQIENFGAGTIQQTVIGPRNYEILLFGEILPAQPDPYPFWHSSQVDSPGLNFALFADEEVDKLLEDARQTNNDEERQQMFRDFQGKILDVKPAFILYRPLYLFAASEKVRGINGNTSAIPSGRFNNIAEWHVKVKRVWK